MHFDGFRRDLIRGFGASFIVTGRSFRDSAAAGRRPVGRKPGKSALE
jgi:hypothetical protein